MILNQLCKLPLGRSDEYGTPKPSIFGGPCEEPPSLGSRSFLFFFWGGCGEGGCFFASHRLQGSLNSFETDLSQSRTDLVAQESLRTRLQERPNHWHAPVLQALPGA